MADGGQESPPSSPDNGAGPLALARVQYPRSDHTAAAVSRSRCVWSSWCSTEVPAGRCAGARQPSCAVCCGGYTTILPSRRPTPTSQVAGKDPAAVNASPQRVTEALEGKALLSRGNARSLSSRSPSSWCDQRLAVRFVAAIEFATRRPSRRDSSTRPLRRLSPVSFVVPGDHDRFTAGEIVDELEACGVGGAPWVEQDSGD